MGLSYYEKYHPSVRELRGRLKTIIPVLIISSEMISGDVDIIFSYKPSIPKKKERPR